ALELKLITSEDRQRLRRRLEEQTPLREFEITMKNKHGEPRHISLSSEPIVIQGERCNIFLQRDITKHKRAEEALRESEELFRTLAETVSAGIYIHRDMRYVYLNPAAERLTGYTRDEFLKMDLLDVIHPDFQEQVKARIVARERGEPLP